MPRSQSLGSHFTIKESVQIPQDSKTISVGDPHTEDPLPLVLLTDCWMTIAP